MKAAQSLYLDLMERVVTNTIYGDANQSPVGKPEYDPLVRQTGKDWPLLAHSMIGVQRMHNLRQLCERALHEHIPGDLIETGIWRGGSCIMMRAVLKAYGDTQRKVYCADSFKGLPTPEAEYPKDAGDRLHEYGQLAISIDQVRKNFAAYDLLDEQVEFVEGFFKDTLHKLPAERFALLRLDGDMYSSTMQALEALYGKVSPGGFIIVDDYGAAPNCRAAIDEYRANNSITAPLEAIDWAGVWWRKP
jgi:O-methyltransferase